MAGERIVSLSSPWQAGAFKRLPMTKKPAPTALAPRTVALPKDWAYYRDLSPEGLGAAYGRLASMVLARKLANGDKPIPPNDRADMQRLAGIPKSFRSSDLSTMIFFANASQLGKGGVVGAVTKAVSSGAKVVKTVVKAADATAIKLAPALAKVPAIGPVAAQAITIAARAQDAIANSSAKGLVSALAHPIQTIGSITGATAGAAVSVAGAAVQGVVALPGQLLAAGEWAASGVASVVGAGVSLAQTFGSSAWATIERNNPALSGELTALFRGLGSEYNQFAAVFDSWSSKLKNATPGTYFGQSPSGNFFQIVKDSYGRWTATKHDPSVVPGTIAQSVGKGSLVPADPALFAVRSLAGIDPQPAATAAQGVARAAAGMSWPMSPYNSAAITDQSLAGIVSDWVKKSLGVEITPAGTLRSTRPNAQPAPQLASMPWWAVLGLAAAAVGLIARSGNAMAPYHRGRR